MKLFTQELINRLTQFSDKLDNTSLFIDKPWVLIGSDSNYHKYIFKRNGDLIMSSNGQVQIGKWEYLPYAKSILIDRVQDKILLNQSFFDSAVMVLNIDGLNNETFVLANEIIIPDLNVRKYLQSLTYKKFNVITGKLENGKTLEIYRGSGEVQPKIGMKATIDGNEPEDGKYKSKKTNRFYEIKNSKLVRITQPFTYKTSVGQNIVIEQKYEDKISIGDFVYFENKLAKSGKYKIGLLNNITVTNGVVSKKSLFKI